jgi:hypothetical protein
MINPLPARDCEAARVERGSSQGRKLNANLRQAAREEGRQRDPAAASLRAPTFSRGTSRLSIAVSPNSVDGWEGRWGSQLFRENFALFTTDCAIMVAETEGFEPSIELYNPITV